MPDAFSGPPEVSELPSSPDLRDGASGIAALPSPALPAAGSPEHAMLVRATSAALARMGVAVLGAEASHDFLLRVWAAHADRIRAACVDELSL